MSSSFSDRFGYRGAAVPITVREDATEDLRAAIVMLAENLGLAPSTMRQSICGILLRAPDPSNWSEYPNISGEVHYLIRSCPWYRVYDIAEEFYRDLLHRDPQNAVTYQSRLNQFFEENGIGWQMDNGQIVARGSEAFQITPVQAIDKLQAAGRPTAAREIHEALEDLSRRPQPDKTGSIQHAMAALECVLRDATGMQNKTLGQILSATRSSGQRLVPPPLDKALESLWGYASEMGRHLREGREPSFEEAELVVIIAAAVSNYLTPSNDAP